MTRSTGYNRVDSSALFNKASRLKINSIFDFVKICPEDMLHPT